MACISTVKITSVEFNVVVNFAIPALASNFKQILKFVIWLLRFGYF